MLQRKKKLQSTCNKFLLHLLLVGLAVYASDTSRVLNFLWSSEPYFLSESLLAAIRIGVSASPQQPQEVPFLGGIYI